MPHGAEQADERGVEPTDARMASPDDRRAVNSSMQLRRQQVTQSLTSRLSCRWALAFCGGGRGFAAFQRQVAEGLVGSAPSLGQAQGKVFAVPEVLGGAGVFLNLMMSSALMRDDDPRGQRHGQQRDGDGAGDKVTLDPDVGDAGAIP